MALKATVMKAALQVADTDRHYYAEHALTLARHPSETDERLMVRLLAFALNADEALEFGRGLSAEDEPALWKKDLTGRIELWIEVGLPDEKAVRRACGRAGQVVVYAYGGSRVGLWWKDAGDRLARCANLRVVEIPAEASQALAKLAQRGMQLQCTIQDGHAWVSDGAASVEVEPRALASA